MKKLAEEEKGLTFWLLQPGNIEDVRLRSEFQELRYSAFRKENRNESGKEVDEHDAQADYIVCVKDGKVVGGCRLIFGKIKELPIGKAATTTNDIPSMEISRLVAENSQVKCSLFGLIYMEAKKRNVPQILAFARKGLVKTLKREHLDLFEILGEPYDYRGLTLIPLAFDITNAPSLVKKHLGKGL